jgi:hypothetical protein
LTSLPKWFKLKANDDDMVFDSPIPLNPAAPCS